jgi:hypothetical protein
MNEVCQWNTNRKPMARYETCDLLLVETVEKQQTLIEKYSRLNLGVKGNHRSKTAKLRDVNPAARDTPRGSHENPPCP